MSFSQADNDAVRPYDSKLDYIRRRALREGKVGSTVKFWEDFTKCLLETTRTIKKQEFIQYHAEATLFHSYWDEPFVGQWPGVSYHQCRRDIFEKAMREKIPRCTLDEAWMKATKQFPQGSGIIGRVMYLRERQVYNQLWPEDKESFRGIDPYSSLPLTPIEASSQSTAKQSSSTSEEVECVSLPEPEPQSCNATPIKDTNELVGPSDPTCFQIAAAGSFLEYIAKDYTNLKPLEEALRCKLTVHQVRGSTSYPLRVFVDSNYGTGRGIGVAQKDAEKARSIIAKWGRLTARDTWVEILEGLESLHDIPSPAEGSKKRKL